MNLVDTHTHLYSQEFNADRHEMISRAQGQGVNKFFLPNIDSSSIEGMLELESRYPGACEAMMGLHPCSVKENYKQELDIVKQWLDRRSFCAVGEIGIDLYWDKSTLAIQQEAFRMQIGWAQEKALPIVIHSRESFDEIFDILGNYYKPRTTAVSGIFHCFTGTAAQAQQALELGFYLGVGGVLTFKKSGLGEALEQVPLDRIVLETDAPYLAPAPHRGKRNESAYLLHIAEKLADLKQVTVEEVARVTTENSKRIFGR